MGKVYAVAIGRIPGFYGSWPACQNQIKGYSKATYKSFTDKKEAALWMQKVESTTETGYSEQLKLEIEIAIHGALALKKITSMEDFESSEKLQYPWQSETRYKPYVYSDSIKQGSLEFFQLDRDLTDIHKTNPELNTIVIYCDGSKMPSVNHLGSGAYCRFRGKDYGFSLPFSSSLSKKYGLTKEEQNVMSSPSMEYLSFSETLWRFISIKLPETNGVAYPLVEGWRLLFVCDYIGVRDFTSGAWVAKETHIIKIHKACSKIIDFLKVRNIHVEILHCDGHKNILGNELADLYAKSQTKTDSIPDLVKDLSKFFEDLK